MLPTVTFLHYYAAAEGVEKTICFVIHNNELGGVGRSVFFWEGVYYGYAASYGFFILSIGFV